MVQITEAIFHDGLLKPVDHIALAEGQRVRLIVQPMDSGTGTDAEVSRSMALKKLLAGIEGMRFYSAGPLPSRDEFDDRV